MFGSKKKREAEFLASYHKIKSDTFNFDRIEKYFRNLKPADYFHIISDKTYLDLDLDEVFMFIDRTSSRVGQQLLYTTLRTISSSSKQGQEREGVIQFFRENNKCKDSVLLQISRLNKHDAYYLSTLFQEDHISRPTWFWVIKLLSLSSIFSILLSFFYPQFLMVLVAILGVNYFIHYWNKRNLYEYAGSIPQLLILNQVAKEIIRLKVPISNVEEVTSSIRVIDSLGKKMQLFKLEAEYKSEIELTIEYLVEIVKALFLIEPILLFNVLQELDSKRSQIHKVFKLVGETDVALSINSLRESVPYFAIPTILKDTKYLSGTAIYHPLLPDPVANSFELDGKSALLTGSNMSGKTTFIRTIGINALLSQCINTCFAQQFVLPQIKVHSAIRITDDLMSNKSYYFEEVLTIKEMLDASRSGGQHLFLLDELFKGTNTVERIAAGMSVLNYLNKGDNMVFISTHDLELATYLKENFRLYHFTEVVDHETILFDYKIKEGNLKTTNAIRILELNQYPADVTNGAKQVAEGLMKIKAGSWSL